MAPESDASPAPEAMPPTPSGAQRTTGGRLKWKPLNPEKLGEMLAPHYEVIALLGAGGMGAVYKGRQPRLNRFVAIKLLPPDIGDDPQFAARFEREAQSMAALSHPAIVPVHDFGETPNGWLYFVMEHVDGSDVQKLIRDHGRLPAEHALAITAHLCDALQYAHSHGVVHRDIKPANVLLNTEGQVKVADFGLAKRDSDAALTRSDMGVGTPDFIAPEALTLGMVPDHRADLYAVGAMLYNMLTGKIPRGMFDLPSVQVPGTDPRFDAIVAKALKADPAKRYQSAQEIRRDLDVILTTPLILAGGASSSAIPKQALAKKPVAKAPQRKEADAGTPVRSPNKGEADQSRRPPPARPKSKAPLFIRIGAAALIAGSGFFYLRQKTAAPSDTPQTSIADSAAAGPGSNEQKEIQPDPPKKPSPSSAQSRPNPDQSLAADKVSPPALAPVSIAPKAPTLADKSPAEKSPVPASAPTTPAAPSAPRSTIRPGPEPARLPDPAKWVQVFTTPESLLKDGGGAEWTSEGIHLSHLLIFPDSSRTDAAVRAKIRLGSYSTLSVRNVVAPHSDGKALDFGIHALKDTIKIQNKQDKTYITLAEFPFVRSSPAAQEIELEVVVVGRVVRVSVDGRVIGSTLDDAEPEAGRITAFSKDGIVRDLAWQPLDPPNPADEKLAALEREGQDRFKREVDAPFDAAAAELAAKFKAALEHMTPAVRGTPAEVHLRAEIARVEKQEPIPPADAPGIPAMLATLRRTWHAEFAKLLAARAKNAATVRLAQDQALAALEKELEDKGDLARVARVKQARTALKKEEAAPAVAALVAPQKSPVNVRSANGGRLKMIGCVNNAALPVDLEPFAKFDDFVSVKIIPGEGVAALRANGQVLVQRLNSSGTALENFSITDPPIAKLCESSTVLSFALTGDGHALQLVADPKKRSGIWSQWDGLVELSGEPQVFSGLKADGTVVLENLNNKAWLPKPETLPRAKALAVRVGALVVLTQEGAVMGWQEIGGEVKAPQVLRHSIVRWKEANVEPNRQNPGSKELVWTGVYLDKLGNLYHEKNAQMAPAARDIDDFGGSSGSVFWHPKHKPWTVNGPGHYGELDKAREVLNKETPIAWDAYSASDGKGGKTGIFVWIE